MPTCRADPRRVTRDAAVLVQTAIAGLALLATATTAAALSVDECVALALRRAPLVEAATADLAAAGATVAGARAAYWPRLAGIAQYGLSAGYNTAVTNGGVTQLGVGAELTLYDGGQRAAALAAARARWRSSSAIARQRDADVTFTTRDAYYAALAAHAAAAIQADTVRALDDYLALLGRQADLGLVPAGDVPRATLALATARSAERDSAAAQRAALDALTILTGVAIDAAALVEPPLGAPMAEADVDGAPIVAEAHAAAEAARHDADAARAERLGRFGLSGDAGFLGDQFRPTFEQNGGGEFLLAFSIPLFDAPLAARVAGAAATADSAASLVREARQTLAIALARARTEAERARADAQAWDAALPAAAAAFLLMRARYLGGGGVRLLDVLDALTQSTDARLAAVRARAAARGALALQDQLLGRSGA
jgi:outer membrane protein TolC